MTASMIAGIHMGLTTKTTIHDWGCLVGMGDIGFETGEESLSKHALFDQIR